MCFDKVALLTQRRNEKENNVLCSLFLSVWETRLWLRCKTLVRVDWRVWCLLELRLLYHTNKGPKDTSFQESILNLSVLRSDTRLWLDYWQYSTSLQTESWLGTSADDMMAAGASIADGQGLACRAWQAPGASGIVLLYILNHSDSLQNVLKWSSTEVRERHDCSKHE